MKLKEDEAIIAEYLFDKRKRVTGMMRLFTPRNKRDTGIRGILTNERLIFISGRNEEHYPLSKITAIRVKDEVIKHIGIATYIFIFLLIALPVIGPLFFNIEYNNGILIGYYLFVIVALIFGLKPVHITRLHISQMGGEKYYDTLANEQLQAFIDKVNETLI